MRMILSSINPRILRMLYQFNIGSVVATIVHPYIEFAKDIKLNLLSPELKKFAANLVKSCTPQQAYKLNRV